VGKRSKPGAFSAAENYSFDFTHSKHYQNIGKERK
jgi:hypothetical protein